MPFWRDGDWRARERRESALLPHRRPCWRPWCAPTSTLSSPHSRSPSTTSWHPAADLAVTLGPATLSSSVWRYSRSYSATPVSGTSCAMPTLTSAGCSLAFLARAATTDACAGSPPPPAGPAPPRGHLAVLVRPGPAAGLHPDPCAASRQTVHRSALAPYAAYSYCRAHSRWFWGCG